MTNHLPQDPDLLRREIDTTRSDMGRTLEEIEDRVSPSRIKERQTERVRSRWEGVKSSVMGSADDLRDHGTDVAHEGQGRMDEAQQAVQDTVQQAPERLEDATRGNPLAAGMIAFGLGALAGSLFPASAPERRAASGLQEQFEEPLKGALKESGEEVKTELQEHAEVAVEETKQTAQHAAERVKTEAQESADHVQQRGQEAAEHVREQR
jgi:ElaB/YqjD/DUF883 family membrane-anchored ribosome-binding protein